MPRAASSAAMRLPARTWISMPLPRTDCMPTAVCRTAIRWWSITGSGLARRGVHHPQWRDRAQSQRRAVSGGRGHGGHAVGAGVRVPHFQEPAGDGHRLATDRQARRQQARFQHRRIIAGPAGLARRWLADLDCRAPGHAGGALRAGGPLCRASSGAGFYYLRATQDNGQLAWSSPVWFEG